MVADKKIIDGLNTSAQMLSHLSGQYRVFKINLKKFGLKWLSHKIDCKYHKTEEQLDIFLCRLFYYRTDPSYEIGSVRGADSVTEILTMCLEMVEAIATFAVEQRKIAFDLHPDYTTDLYEHLIKTMEKQEFFLSQQLDLIKTMKEPGYIGARLEDNV